uniref:CRAL-TRIO domain-containing protein n=1 Tax=Anopheles maculatus TaxID=74869 RepID=A0A182SKM0_9DIPT
MRGNGNTAASAKMILKVLQENFGTDVIHQAVIIKPDNFWHKQRSSIASNKYKFETTTISIQSLGKLVEPSQLTSDFEGFLHYDHAVWIDLRVAFEDFLWQASDILDRIDDLQEDLTHSECPEDVNGAKHSIDAHNEMKRKILKLPIEDLDLQGQKLLGKLTTYSNRNDDGCHSAPLPTNCINPDVTSAMNQVRKHTFVRWAYYGRTQHCSILPHCREIAFGSKQPEDATQSKVVRKWPTPPRKIFGSLLFS